MKKKFGALALAVLIGALLFTTADQAYAIGKAVILEPESVTMYVGEKKTLKMYVGGGRAAAAGWSSNSTKTAAVSKKGVVTAKKAGKATITCKTGFGYNLKCKVTVKKKTELSGYLNKKYTSLAKKAPKAKRLSEAEDPAGIGNVYVFQSKSGTEPFFRYDIKTGKIQMIQLSAGGDASQNHYQLYGVSLKMTMKKAKAALKAKKWKYTGKQTYDSGTHLNFKKSGHAIKLIINKGKVTTIQWS